MAKFRVNKTSDFTVMSNYHLRDRELSLKAKGLQSLMLSLPENWDYTTKGLAHICKDGIDAISSALKELEQQGYLTRERVRLSNGRLGDIEYTIHEQPEQPENPDMVSNSPKRENPRQVNPRQVKPVQENPEQENPAQLNINKLNNKILNTHSIKNQSINPSILPGTDNHAHARESAGDGLTDGQTERERIKNQIEYELLPNRGLTPWQLRQADELLELMVEVALTQSTSIQIGQATYPADYVKERFAKLRCEHIEQVLIGLSENEGRVTNVRGYLLASLFNATATLESAYGLSAAYG